MSGKQKQQPPLDVAPCHPFLRLTKLFTIVVRLFGYFPAHSDRVIHYANIWSFAIIALLLVFDFYSMTWKTFFSLTTLMYKFSVPEAVWFALLIRQYACFVCVLMLANIGYGKQLEKFDAILFLANEQKGIYNGYKKLKYRFIFVTGIYLTGICMMVCSIYPLILLYKDSGKDWPGATKIKHVFGDKWYAHLFVIIKVMFNSMATCCATLLYWVCCASLQAEFRQLNAELENCDMSKVSQLKALSLVQVKLFAALRHLSGILAAYVATFLACSSIISIVFFYLLILNDVALSFRLLSLCYIIVCASINVLLCFSTEALHNEVAAAKEIIIEKLAKENAHSGINAEIYQTANIIAQHATLDAGITALGFFTVSKRALLAIYSFIATYVVILLQTPVDLTTASSPVNATNAP